jgi:hypothetical protein
MENKRYISEKRVAVHGEPAIIDQAENHLLHCF